MSAEEMSEMTRVMITIIYFIKANFMAVHCPHRSFWTMGRLSKEERIRVAQFYLQNGSVVQTAEIQGPLQIQKSSSHKEDQS